MTLKKVGVVGCGLMGHGIAQVAAQGGFEVTVVETEQAFLDKGLGRIDKSLAKLAQKLVEKGKKTEEEAKAGAEATRKRITGSLERGDLADCDLVVEAIIEDLDVKQKLFAELGGICKPETILASNTSSLPIAEMAEASGRPQNMVGLHFFNPVPVMELVEVVRTIATSDEAFGAAYAFAEALGKKPITAKDNSGFVVNLLLVPYMLDAIRQLERGVASIQDIDQAMTLGLGHPMGPFTLCDFVGIDTVYRISQIMFDEYREGRYAAPPLLKRIVSMGRFGRKTGKGFYDWSGERPIPLPL